MSLGTTDSLDTHLSQQEIARLHIASSPECSNFTEYCRSHFNSALEQEFYFLSGSEEDLPRNIRAKAIHFKKDLPELKALLQSFTCCHIHWAFDPALMQLLNQLNPDCYMIVSYLTDDYSSSEHIPTPLLSFVDELILAETPDHIAEAAKSVILAAPIFDIHRSSGLSSVPSKMLAGEFERYIHIWRHPRVGSILNSNIDFFDPRLSGYEAGGSWYFSDLFPDLNECFNLSRKSFYPQKALEADDIIRSRARKLLDMELEKFQRFFPDDSHLRYLLGLCFLETGLFDRADYLLSSVSQILHPWRVDLLRAQVQEGLQNNDLALEHYSSVLKKYPECKQAKEGMRALVLPDGALPVFSEPENTSNISDESSAGSALVSKQLAILSTYDETLFELLSQFLSTLMRDGSFRAYGTANEAFRELFYMPSSIKSYIQVVLCNEDISFVEKMFSHDISHVFIATPKNSQVLKQKFSLQEDFSFFGTTEKLPETLFLLARFLGSPSNAYVSLPSFKKGSFERLDSREVSEQVIPDEVNRSIADSLLALSPKEQSNLDFYTRALALYPEIQAASHPNIRPEVVQVMLQNGLKHLGVISGSEESINQLRDLMDLTNDKLQRQVLFTGEGNSSKKAFEKRLDSASEFAKLKQFDFICLADSPEANIEVLQLLLNKGISKSKIVLASKGSP